MCALMPVQLHPVVKQFLVFAACELHTIHILLCVLFQMICAACLVLTSRTMQLLFLVKEHVFVQVEFLGKCLSALGILIPLWNGANNLFNTLQLFSWFLFWLQTLLQFWQWYVFIWVIIIIWVHVSIAWHGNFILFFQLSNVLGTLVNLVFVRLCFLFLCFFKSFHTYKDPVFIFWADGGGGTHMACSQPISECHLALQVLVPVWQNAKALVLALQVLVQVWQKAKALVLALQVLVPVWWEAQALGLQVLVW